MQVKPFHFASTSQAFLEDSEGRVKIFVVVRPRAGRVVAFLNCLEAERQPSGDVLVRQHSLDNSSMPVKRYRLVQ